MANEVGRDDRMVVGYFADGANASRAINELIDEGFGVSEIGAAFRTRQTGIGSGTISGEEVATDTAQGAMTGREKENPAVSGSIGGAASHDEAVTPAGLAPGSGNAFPAPSRPGPIPGGELPRTLPRDLPSTLASDLPSTLREKEQPVSASQSMATTTQVEARRSTRDESWWEHVKHAFGGGAKSEVGPRLANSSSQKFGTGEGHLDLYPQMDYSEPSFESSFVGMGLGPVEARTLSAQLSQGGAVITVNATQRASLAEAILERNHGRVRLESPSDMSAADLESRVEVYGSMRDYYGHERDLRRAS